MTIHCYAQRMLNPFRGVLYVMRYKAAEAVTIDGINWDIYVTDDELLWFKIIRPAVFTYCFTYF